jgi:hypothetical protein
MITQEAVRLCRTGLAVTRHHDERIQLELAVHGGAAPVWSGRLGLIINSTPLRLSNQTG